MIRQNIFEVFEQCPQVLLPLCARTYIYAHGRIIGKLERHIKFKSQCHIYFRELQRKERRRGRMRVNAKKMYFTWWDRLEADLTSQPIHATTFHSSGDYLNDMLILAINFFACTDPYPYPHPQPFVCCVMAESSRDFNLEYKKRVSTHRNTHHSILYLCHTLDINRMAW